MANTSVFLRHERRGRILSATAARQNLNLTQFQCIVMPTSAQKSKTSPAESGSFHVIFYCFDRYSMTADKPVMLCIISITSDL